MIIISAIESVGSTSGVVDSAMIFVIVEEILFVLGFCLLVVVLK